MEGLNFVITADGSQVESQIDKMVDRFTRLAAEAVSSGKSVDDAMKDFAASVNKALADMADDGERLDVLKGALESINDELVKMEDGEAKNALKSMADSLDNIVSTSEKTSRVDEIINGLSNGSINARTALRELNQELIAMRLRGEENTEEYRQLLEQLGKIQDVASDTQQAVRGMASDTANLSAVMGAAQATAGGFSAIMGAMNLVGAGENTKELAEAQKKLQAVMAITTGLMSVQNALQKQSNLMLGIQRLQTLAAAKAENIKTAATGKNIVATKAATIAQRAFNAVANTNPYVLLAAAILSVVGALVAFSGGAKESEKQQEGLNSELERQLGILKELNGAYDTLYENQKNELKNNLELLKAQGASIDDIRAAEDALDDFERQRIDRQKKEYDDIISKEQELANSIGTLSEKIKKESEVEEGWRSKLTDIENGGEAPYKDAKKNFEYWAEKSAERRKALEDELKTNQEALATIHKIQQDEANYNNNEEIKKAKRDAEDSKRQKDAAKEASDRRKKSLEEQKRYEEELEKATQRAEDLRIENETEGLEKRIKKISTEYGRQIDEAEEKSQQARNDKRIELAEQYEQQAAELRKRRDDLIKQEREKEIEENKKQLDELLDQYKTYADEEQSVREKYAKNIEKLNEQKDKATTPEERERIERAIVAAEEKQKQELKDIAVEYSTINKLEKKIAELEKDKVIAFDNGDLETVKKINEELDRLRKLLAKYQKEADQKGAWNEFWDKLADEDKVQKICGYLNDIGEAIADIGKAAGNTSLKDIGEAFGGIADMAQGMMQGFAQGGLIGAAVSLATSIGNEIVDYIATEKKMEAAIRQANFDKFVTEQGKLLDNVSTIFGNDSIASVNNSLQVISNATQKLKDLEQEYIDFDTKRRNANFVFDSGSFNAMIMEYTRAVNEGLSGLESMTIRTKDRNGFANWLGLSDEFKSLNDAAKELGYTLYDETGKLNKEALQAILDTYDDLGAEERQWIENAIKDLELYEEAAAQVTEYLTNMFGNMADTIADGMLDSFLKTGNAAVEWKDLMGDVSKQMAKDFIKNMLITEVFDNYQGKMKKIMMSNGMSDDDKQQAMLAYFAAMQGDIDKLQPAIQAYLEGMSHFFGTTDEMQSQAGNLLQSASQDSIDLVNGQMNAIRMNQMRSVDALDNIVMNLTYIQRDMNRGFSDSVTQLSEISRNTSNTNRSVMRGFGLEN